MSGPAKVVIWSCPDLPRPVQEDKYLLQTSGNIFPRNYTFPFLINQFIISIKSCVLLIKFIIFYKIIRFFQQTYIFLFAETRLYFGKIKRGVQRQSREEYVNALMAMVPASRVYVHALGKPNSKRTIRTDI